MDLSVSNVEKRVWESMLDADMSTRYWGKLARRYKQRETWAKVFLAGTSSGTVAGWAFWTSFPLAWKVLSSLSALIAISLPILNYPHKIEAAVDLHAEWKRLLYQYETLWSKTRDNVGAAEVLRSIKAFKEDEAQVSKKEAQLPQVAGLVRRCQEEVKHSRGI